MRVEIIVTTGPAKGQRFRFDQPDHILFGRTDAPVSFPDDPSISRQHCLLEISPAVCILKDLNSKNGMIVNGMRYGGRVPPKIGVKQAPDGMNEVRLKDGDVIIIGDTGLKVSIQPDPWMNKAQVESGSQQLFICCSLCGKNITNEVELSAQTLQTKPMCTSCREKSAGEALEKIVGDALAEEKSRVATKSSSGLPNIEGYQIEQEIKYGGIEKIYKAKEITTGRSVTIKALFLQRAIEPYKIHTFQRELNIIRQINHQHIVRFLGYGKTSDILYLVFEFVDGPDLAKFIRSQGGHVAIQQALPLCFGILNGLAYAHHAKITLQQADGKSQTFEGIVHRNLKPQNILLAHEGNSWIPKIADFGLLKCFEAADLTDITTSGDVFGTPVYWPREQITHYKYLGPATDVFSIAAVFYEMLTGSWVREGFRELATRSKQRGRPPNISDYMNVITANPSIPIRQRNPNIPEPVANVIDRALREEVVPFDPTKMQEVLKALRYPDAGAFRDALYHAFQESGGGKSSPKPSLNAQRKSPDQSTEEVIGKKGHRKPSSDSTATYSDSQATVSKEVALVNLDLAQSTQYIMDAGDTSFSMLIGIIFRRIKTHASSADLISLKGTGDGFLAAFRTMSAALSLALTFLEAPVHTKAPVRMALHWGSVKITPNEDVFGMEIYKVAQIEKVTIQDLITPAVSGNVLPEVNRLLVTKQGWEQLDDSDRARFRPVGKFQLKGFDEFYDLWVINK
jgi:serine/threonine protein kinase